MKINTLTIIIPVYNEEKRIIPTIQSVLKANTMGLKKEIIIVDDGSTDKTAQNVKIQISNIKSSNHRILFIQLKENSGKGAALKAGFAAATGDILLVQDADLEYDTGDYPALIAPFLKQNAQVVYGSRNRGEKVFHNRYSYFVFYWGGKALTGWINLLFGLRLTDQPTGYKVFHGDLKKLLAMPGENGFEYEIAITGLLAKKRILFTEVPIRYHPRTLTEGKKIGMNDFVKGVVVAIRYAML